LLAAWQKWNEGGANPYQIRNAIIEGAVPLDIPYHEYGQGNGYLNMPNSLTLLQNGIDDGLHIDSSHGLDAVDLKGGTQTWSTGDLGPARTFHIVIAVDEDTASLDVSLTNVVFTGDENPYMGDSIEFYIQSAIRTAEYYYVYNENLILRSNLMRMSRENAILRQYAHEMDRLRNLLEFSQDHPEQLRCARVVQEVETRMGGGIVLDRGSDSGLKKNMTVICPEGLVGRIVKVRSHVSLVKRVIDPGYRVSALTQRARSTGILGAGNRGQLAMEWVSPNTEVVPGDTVISSGLGSITPKGVLIGRVVDIHEKSESFSLSLEVEPFVDFRRLEEVFVIMREPPDYRALFDERGDQR